MAKSIGIDLGTTNSVAAIRKVKTEILKNSEGEFITPSCVNIKKGLLRKTKFVVGKNALEWIKQDPENTIVAIKRLIGRNHNDPEVLKFKKEHRLGYHIAKYSKGTENSLVVLAAGQEFTPEEISAKILAKIKKDAEDLEKTEVDYAVITVPAYFNDKQKHGTRVAAALAGLKVRRLLPEPTAAAISFGVDNIKGDDAIIVLVFDFGGGTLDLSVLTISGGQFIEQGKGGDMWMGGTDIDRLISDYVLDETAKEYSIDDMESLIADQDSKIKNRFLAELKVAVENAKIRLSDKEEAHVEVLGILRDDDGDPVDIDVELTRQQFNKIIAPMIDSILRLTDNIIEKINFTPDLIDKVLLVGGSSKIPMIISALTEKFGKDKVMVHAQPMLAIAEGAAILSHRLADTYECPQCGTNVGQNDLLCPNCSFDLEKYTIDQGVFDIVHTTAHDYYIQTANDERYLLVEKNTPLPCSVTEVFNLVHAYQQMAHLKFFNTVNGTEQAIGDLWLGIDSEKLNNEDHNTTEEKALQIQLTINIDENNLVEINACLKNHPEIQLSRVLSRGNADEKLFINLENEIAKANSQQYTEYVVLDLESRIVSIIKNIDRVIAPQTDKIDEKMYDLAAMKIEKSFQIAEDGKSPKAVINYCNSMLSSFAMAIAPRDLDKLRNTISKLKEMDEHGTYKENVRAFEQLDKLLEEEGLQIAQILSNIQHAGELCYKTDPAKAPKFFRATDDIIEAVKQENEQKAAAIIMEIMPEVQMIRKTESTAQRKIYKDIAK